MLFLISGDEIFMLQSQRNIVQPLQQELSAVFFQVERVLQAIIVLDRLVFQIDMQPVSFMLGCALEQLFHLFLRQRDGQNAVFEAVVVKNVGKGRGDDHPKSVIQNGPGRVFPGGAATEVVAGDQDGRPCNAAGSVRNPD